jgi:hypothetical protein
MSGVAGQDGLRLAEVSTVPGFARTGPGTPAGEVGGDLRFRHGSELLERALLRACAVFARVSAIWGLWFALSEPADER